MIFRMNKQDKRRIMITCSPGLSGYLRDEVEALGFKVTSCGETSVSITGTLIDTIRLNLTLRTAYNVLFELKEFGCNNPEALYRECLSLPWEDIVDSDGYLSVVSRVSTRSIDNTMFPNLKVKDAIVDRVKEKTGKRPDSGPDKNRLVVHLYWKDRRATLYLNTSGVKISDRSYRRMPFKAPMRESLAAAVMTETGYDGTTPLIVPMCGSGTLAIEAALMATGRAPGLLRANFGFMHIKFLEKEDWESIRREIRKERKSELAYPIIATDIAPGAIEAAKKNAMTAGVDHLIDFDICDFADTRINEENGVVILNPEYGQRMGEVAQLEKTYARIGDFFKQKCQGYTAYIFTGNLPLSKKVGLRTSRRTEFFNADIECRLLRYEMYDGSRKGESV